MKSAHRHELQTNSLAQRLDVALQTIKPHVATILGAIAAIAVLLMIWSYVSNSAAQRQGDAWNSFNQAVGSMPPDMNELHQSAQEHPGTPMQQLADITWADGQVFMATENFLYNRNAANEALDRAASAYQGVLQTSRDERLANRAHLGLARVYEMRNDLEKAREEYGKVRGGYADYAKLRAERLADPEVIEAYAWLAKAEAPRVRPPAGPGTPGQRPAFSPGDITLPPGSPDAGAATAPAGPAESGESFEELLQGLREFSGDAANGKQGTPPTTTPEGLPGTGTPATGETAPRPGAPETTPPATGTTTATPAELPATAVPASTDEKPAE